MDTSKLTNPIVREAIDAMNKHDRTKWLSLFASHAMLTDDGNPRNVLQWSDSELFGKDKGHLTTVDKIEENGLTLYGKFHSDRWGDFKTFMKFQVDGDKIVRLDVGQAQYTEDK